MVNFLKLHLSKYFQNDFKVTFFIEEPGYSDLFQNMTSAFGKLQIKKSDFGTDSNTFNILYLFCYKTQSGVLNFKFKSYCSHAN